MAVYLLLKRNHIQQVVLLKLQFWQFRSIWEILKSAIQHMIVILRHPMVAFQRVFSNFVIDLLPLKDIGEVHGYKQSIS